jgi:DNA-binding NtrC family response regulator
VERLAPATQRILDAYQWPGNVRELKNVVEYAFAIGEGPIFAETDLPPELVAPSPFADDSPPAAEDPPPAVASPVTSTNASEASRILRALERSAGSRERAAQVLGVSRVTLWRRMKSLGLDRRDAS